jgi:hypothetical protein
MFILPGAPEYRYIGGYNWSYFFHRPQQVSELTKKIYEIGSAEEKTKK